MNPATTPEEIPSAASQENSSSTPQEATASVVLQNSMKLNLPPKPILANALVPPAADSITETSSPSSTQETPSISFTSSPKFSSTLELPSTSMELKEENISQKKFYISLPLAFLFFLIALLALLIELRFFLNK
jgi:hypothetical protein